MRHFFLLLTLAVWPAMTRAQIFDFGWPGDPFVQRQQQPREQVKGPEYKGGEEAIRKFQKQHYKNPTVDRRDVEGRVVVACIINEKGKVAETHVVRSVGREFDDEAQRVCRKMKFKPALRGKKKVKSRFDITFPIRRSRLSFSTLRTTDV